MKLGRVSGGALSRGFLAVMVLFAPALAQDNVLLVVLDDVGVDRVAAYGALENPPATPTMDGLAARGVRFDRCWSTPFCSPTRATLMTGRYGFRTGIGVPLREGEKELSVEEWSLPRTLNAATKSAYFTAAIGKWHLAGSAVAVEHPRRMGFEHYAGCPNNLRSPNDRKAYFSWTKVVDGKAAPAEGYLTTDTTDDALRAIAAAGERPWLVYLAYHAAHTPIHRPPEHLFTRELKGTALTEEAEFHKAMVEAIDHELGRLLGTLDPEVLARTTVIVVGDNGTQGTANEPPWDKRRGKGTLFEGGVRVPLIVAGAGVSASARGTVCQAPVNTTDLWLSTLELCGADAQAVLPEGWEHDSVSFTPLLQDPAAPHARDFLFAEHFVPNYPGAEYEHRNAALRVGDHKLVRNLLDGTDRLYDLSRSPLEKGNLLRDGTVPEGVRAVYADLQERLEALLPEGDSKE